jgi:hypothetical protein
METELTTSKAVVNIVTRSPGGGVEAKAVEAMKPWRSANSKTEATPPCPFLAGLNNSKRV